MISNEKWRNIWDKFVLFITLLFPIHYFSSQYPELASLFFVAIIAIKEVVSFMSAASQFADIFPKELIRKDCIPKDAKNAKVICFQEAKGEAEEKAKQQKVAK